MEGFQAEDRHNPLPHIAPLTTAPKSAYRNTASPSTHTATELRELPIPGGREWWSSPAALLGMRPRRDWTKCVITQRQLHSRSADRRIACDATRSSAG
jgi:hypothetical protein